MMSKLILVTFACLVAPYSATSYSQIIGNGQPSSGAKKLVERIARLEANGQQGNSSFQYEQHEINQLHAELASLERLAEANRVELAAIRERLGNHVVQASLILPPCTGTKQHVYRNESGEWDSVPNGVLCVGHRRNPSPNDNFVVYAKNNTGLFFLGTQSRAAGFVDFTAYLGGMLNVGRLENCQVQHGCDLLPQNLRWNAPGGLYQNRYHCSASFSENFFLLPCVRDYSNNVMLVNDNGAISNFEIHSSYSARATVWY